jgi:hypothetical protein
MPRTTRATQPVWVISDSSRLSKRISASPEIVSPRRKIYEKRAATTVAHATCRIQTIRGIQKFPYAQKGTKPILWFFTILNLITQAGIRCQ